MKFYSSYIILFVAAAYSCKKGTDSNTILTNTRPANTILILEKFTNQPIAGATVSLKKCSDFDFEFGCQKYTTHTNLISNAAGQVTIPGNKVVDAIECAKDNYWTNFITNVSDVTLTPISIIQVSIKKIKAYAAGDILNIGVTQPNCFYPTCLVNLQPIGLPSDTIIYLKGYGYSDNIVSWYVTYLTTDTLHSSPSIFTNGFDFAKVAIEY